MNVNLYLAGSLEIIQEIDGFPLNHMQNIYEATDCRISKKYQVDDVKRWRSVCSVFQRLSFSDFTFSAKPQEFKVRVEKRHEAKKEVLGHSKQAEFVKLMEQEVKLAPFVKLFL